MELRVGDTVFDVRYGVRGTVVKLGKRIEVSFSDKDIGEYGKEYYLLGGVLEDGRKVLKYDDDSLNLRDREEFREYMPKIKQFLELLRSWK